MWAAEWNEVVFTDESRISLQHHDGRIRVWKHCGERMLSSCFMHRHTGPAPGIMIVRVQYFVRGGSVGHRSRASSKHLSPHLPVGELDSSGGKTGVALHLQMHVWVSGPQRKPTRC
ncbi:hypothetical protein TNCV_3572561 [Trichonephila clavipes]|nr:hypothetical protein TNCV_3572561 [Trichonephila clavipes]